MLRKSLISLFISIALLFVIFTLASAQGQGQAAAQMDMETPTATLPPTATPIPDLPLSGTQSMQSGTCPMMSGTDMTGMQGMGGMSGMGGMNGMSGSGMQGMQGMQGTGSMNMQGMSGMTYAPVPWYGNPWWVLGWVLVALVGLAILLGVVYIFTRSIRRSPAAPPPASS